jgi:glycosidase
MKHLLLITLLTGINVHSPVIAKTFFSPKNIDTLNIDSTPRPAAWINSAIIYEITPATFVKDGTFNDITKKLSELKQLGVNTIWLQPIFKTHFKGQGYDITDYFSLRSEFGDETQLQKLIVTAKKLQLRVILDFVPNHISVFHPYAIDVAEQGKASRYYNFFQHTNDGAPYSSLYQTDSLGFVHYFWNHLVNLDYNNEEVQQLIIDACKYWVRKFDIDGYRFDAVWAVNARAPSFGKRLQSELKSVKPDLLLLAEDKGADGTVYEKGFDAAYDWEIDTTWISHWSWEYDYSPQNDLTIFNHPVVAKRSELLRKALFHNGDSVHPRLRFIENNDLPRFTKIHGIERTKMAAALLFSLSGIPLIYNGQEIGSTVHPYSSRAIFSKDQTIESLDSSHLFNYYKSLIDLRKKYESLRSPFIEELQVSSNGVVAFHRWSRDQHIIVVINMDEQSQNVKVFAENILTRVKNYKMKDMLTNEIFLSANNEVDVKMNGYSTRILLLTK